jgi:hypothetical protein
MVRNALTSLSKIQAYHGLRGNMNPHFIEPQVFAALIAAFSALVIAILQFFTQRRQSASIEQLKARLAKQSATETKYLETYRTLLWKDDSNKLTPMARYFKQFSYCGTRYGTFSYSPSHTIPPVICQEISDQSDAIVEIYSANQLQLGEAGRAMAHLVKDIARNLGSELGQIRRLNSEFKTREQLQNLKYTEGRLAKLQTELRRYAIEANSALVRSLEAGNGKEDQ